MPEHVACRISTKESKQRKEVCLSSVVKERVKEDQITKANKSKKNKWVKRKKRRKMCLDETLKKKGVRSLKCTVRNGG